MPFSIVPLVERENVPELFVNGIAYIEAAGGDNLRIAFYATHGPLTGGPGSEREVRIRLVASACDVRRAAMQAAAAAQMIEDMTTHLAH